MYFPSLHRSLLIATSLSHCCNYVSAEKLFAGRSSSRIFDYVIVGGGPAGITLANRLTEDSSITVALVEAGTWPEDVYGNITQVPGYGINVYGGTPDIEWGFTTTPQAAFNNATATYYRAKTLGGGTSINSMSYCYTSKGALQLWADIVGDQAYTYDNMLQYYQKSINFSTSDLSTRYANATPRYATAQTGAGGLLSVRFSSYAESWSTWVAKGIAAIGIEPTDAFLNGNLNGSSWQLQSITSPDSLRSSAATAYLRPVLNRTNLALFTKTFAERVIFNDQKSATGVEVTANGTTFILAASKEVILSAGAFQSPQLLMVSGVGPADLLEQYNITVIANRTGVGRSMNDHINTPISYQVALTTLSTTNTVLTVPEFQANGTGPLANPGGDFVALEKIPSSLRTNFSADTEAYLASHPDDWPEMEYLVLPFGAGTQVAGVNYGTILPTLLAPRSHGTITISSASMRDAPIINPNWFSEQSDIDLMVAGFKRARQALSSEAMAGVVVGDEVFPGPAVQTDQEIITFLRSNTHSISHASSTCKMGLLSVEHSVVDSHCKVWGVTNLRVVDASALPFLPPGPSPQAQVYLLAEKIADDIKNGK